jgi:hypothetical protein
MKTYKLISARDARESGLYEDGRFILERPEEEYDQGIWLLPEDGGYAEWYCSIDALIQKAEDEFDA